MSHPLNSSPISPSQKRVLAGGAVGQFIEFYDFGLYGLTALVLAHHFFPADQPGLALLATFATFAVAFVVRPLGGLFFGALGDRIGRKPVLVITLMGIGIATALIGLLPSYSAIGILAPILLLLCRMVQGFSAGGESVGAPAFVMEHAPLRHRGLWLSITLAATALPGVLASGIMLLLDGVFGAQAFSDWAWRIPFLLALPFSFFGLWIRRRTEESPEFKALAAAHEQREFSPIREAFQKNGLRIAQIILICGLTALTFYFLAGYFVTFLQVQAGLSRGAALGLNAGVMVAITLLSPLTGALGDRVGRKPLLIVGSALLAVVSVPAFMLTSSGSLGLASLGLIIYVLALVTYSGGSTSTFVEAFSTRTRFTSAAIAYNVGYAVLGGTAPMVGTWLVEATGVKWAPGVYLALYALLVLVVIVLTRFPETNPLKSQSSRPGSVEAPALATSVNANEG